MWMCVASENALFPILAFDFVQLGSHVSQVVGKLIRLFINVFLSFPFFPLTIKNMCQKRPAMIRSIADISCPVTFCCFHSGSTEPGAGTCMNMLLTRRHSSKPPLGQRSKKCMIFLLEIIDIYKYMVYQGLLCEKFLLLSWEWAAITVIIIIMMVNVLRHFSADDPNAVTNSGQATIHLKMNSCSMAVSKEAHTAGRGKVPRESLMVRSWASRIGQLRTLLAWIPSWNSVWITRRCKPPSGWSQPCVSQLPALYLLQRKTLVALMWPVQLLVPKGAKADFSEVLSFDWLRFRLCVTPCE